MTRNAFWIVGLVALCGGCGGQDPGPYLRAVEVQQAAYLELGKILSGVSDEQSMAEAKKLLVANGPKFEEDVRHFKTLPPPNANTLQQLQKAGGGLQRNVERVLDHIRRIKKLPGGEAFLSGVPALGELKIQD